MRRRSSSPPRCLALPDVTMGTAETKRVLPPTVPHAAIARTTEIGRAHV
jgi:hypothetical protein